MELITELEIFILGGFAFTTVLGMLFSSILFHNRTVEILRKEGVKAWIQSRREVSKWEARWIAVSYFSLFCIMIIIFMWLNRVG